LALVIGSSLFDQFYYTVVIRNDNWYIVVPFFYYDSWIDNPTWFNWLIREVLKGNDNGHTIVASLCCNSWIINSVLFYGLICAVTKMLLCIMCWSVCFLQHGISWSDGCFYYVFKLPDQDYCNLEIDSCGLVVYCVWFISCIESSYCTIKDGHVFITVWLRCNLIVELVKGMESGTFWKSCACVWF
jgi:hypothetical protein